MTSGVAVGGGVFLIILSMIFFITAIPSLNESISTDTGKPLENATSTFKMIYNTYSLMLAVIPILLLGMGVLLLWKG